MRFHGSTFDVTNVGAEIGEEQMKPAATQTVNEAGPVALVHSNRRSLHISIGLDAGDPTTCTLENGSVAGQKLLILIKTQNSGTDNIEIRDTDANMELVGRWLTPYKGQWIYLEWDGSKWWEIDRAKSYQSSNDYGAGGIHGVVFGDDNIASGSFSAAMGGKLNTASGSYSTCFGRSGIASGSRATTMGEDTLASGDYALAGGDTCVASGDHSTAFGDTCTASGTRSLAFGENTTASGDRSIATGGGQYTGTDPTTASGILSQAHGIGAIADNYGEVAYGSGKGYDTPVGIFQSGHVTYRGQTTDDTETEIYPNGDSDNQFLFEAVDAGAFMFFEVMVLGARKDSYGDTVAGFKITGMIQLLANNTTSIIGTNVTVEASGLTTGYAATVTADNVNEGISINVTGASGEEVHWVAEMRYVKIRHILPGTS